jgi:amino acid adenylation domain-containing protein/non-ribosomal peptide synthase protein (TIGR01720 family)/FkbM family methyltransferase
MPNDVSQLASFSMEEKRALLEKLLREKARRVDEEYPLSHGQQALWFLHQVNPNSPTYNESWLWRIRSDLDVQLLRSAFQALMARHPTLRTTYANSPAGPVQRVHHAPPVVFEAADASGWRPHQLQERLSEEARRPFDLATGPVMRFYLCRLSAQEHVLLTTTHHIVLDLWSMTVLMGDLQALYAMLKAGVPPQLPPLPVGYKDFVAWQTRMLAGPEGERLWSYWLKQLGGELPVLQLPTDRPRPPALTDRGATHPFEFSRRLTRGLRELARQEGVTLYPILLASIFALLHRWTGQDDVLVGCLAAGRGQPEFEKVIGFFANMLPLRGDLSGRPTFRSLLRQARKTTLEGLEHQSFPFSMLVQRLLPHRDPSRSPLCDVTLQLQNAHRIDVDPDAERFEMASAEDRTVRLSFGDAVVELLHLEHPIAKNDVNLMLFQTAGQLAGWAHYNTDLFDAGTIQRLVEHWVNLLEGAVADPDREVASLPLMSELDRRQVLREWNATRIDYPRHVCLHDLIQRQVENTPNAIALAFEGRELSYRELNQRSNRLAHHLRRLGVGPDVLVGVCAERSLEMVVALLAVLKAGGAYTPLDPDYPSERLAFMLRDAQAPVLLTQRRLADLLAEHQAHVVFLDDEVPAWADSPDDNPHSAVTADHLAYVIYTSGSTGNPKGCLNTHRGIVNRLLWMQDAYRLTNADRVLQKTPYSFDVSVWEFFWPLLTGARLVLAQPGGHRDPAYLVKLIAEQRITTLHFVPSMLQVFLQEPGLERLDSLRTVVCSGEALSLELQQHFFRRLACQLYNLYGPTEAAVDVTHWTCDWAGGRPVVPIGRPIANIQTYVLDARLRPLPVGVPGELYLGGVGVGRGYLNRPELTASRFVPDPFGDVPGARLYRTGDRVRWLADGQLEYLGRLDFQVKIRGFRIELGEIEVVLQQHPAVGSAAVVVREGVAGDRVLAAYVVPDRKSAPTILRWLGLEKEGRLAGRRQQELPNGMVIFHQNQAEAAFLYREIFEEHLYLRHGVTLPEGACVFDVGAHVGLFSLFVTHACKNARVFAFEPIPPVFETLCVNTELHGGNVKLFPCGLGRETGSADFSYYPHASIMSGRFADVTAERQTVAAFLAAERRTEPGKEAPSEELLGELLKERLTTEQYNCQIRTLSEVIREQGVDEIDLLKIDAEKSELEVLEGIAAEDWGKIRQLVVEVHDINGRLAYISALLRQQGYDVTAEQDAALAATGLYNVYARRPTPLSPETENEGMDVASPFPLSSGERAGSLKQLVEELRRFLTGKVPEYMVPSAVVLLDDLPLTASGKLNRNALPAPNFQTTARTSVLPRNPTEQVVADVWAELLRLPSVSVLDNFFELGGHSLLAAQAASRLRAAFPGAELPLRQFFDAPTVAALAEAIDRQVQQGQSVAPLPPMVVISRPEELPLSFAQQRLWFLDQLEPGSPFYNIPGAVEINGFLDVDLLRRALAEVVRRHEALRTNIVTRDGRPSQRISATTEGTLPVVDLAHVPQTDWPHEVRQRALAEASRPFDLATGPLWRLTLLRRHERQHALLLTMHHIISDGWSLAVLVDELAVLYRAFAGSKPSPLPELPLQYADYAIWQRGWLQGERLQAQLAYWQQQLAGLTVLELPTDRPRPVASSYRGAREPLVLSPELTEGLRALSRQEGATLFMTLVAAWQILLGRYSGQDDVAVGVPVANRGQAETEGLIGLFVNTLVLRADLSDDPPFREFLGRVRESCLGAYGHQDVPFERVLEAVQPDRDLSRNALFQVMFSWQIPPLPRLELGGLQISPLPTDSGTAQFDLSLDLAEEGDRVEGSLEYNTDLFDRGSAAQLLGRLEVLLKGIVSNPSSRLRKLPLLTAAERRQVVQWNETEAPSPRDVRLHELFEEHVAATPEAAAVVQGNVTLSYADLDRRANRLAHQLQSLGVGPDVRVGLCLPKTPEMVVGMLGTLKAGGAYVPLDPDLPQERLDYMLADAGTQILLTQRELANRWVGFTGTIVCLDTDAVPVRSAGGMEGESLPGSSARPAWGSTANLAYVIYTSGSTGRPKGVACTHQGVVNLLEAIDRRRPLRPGQAGSLWTSIGFDVSVYEIFSCLCFGGALHIPSEEARHDPQRLFTWLAAHGVASAYLPPAFLDDFGRWLEQPGCRSALVRLLVGVEGIPGGVLRRLLQRIPGLAIVNGYGPTETSICATLYDVQGNEEPARNVPIGSALPHTSVYLLDRYLQPVPVRAPGEIYIAGRGLAWGYLNSPALTAEKYLPNPFGGPGERLYRTGDHARFLPDGNLEFLGRRDQQIKLRGHRIDLGEIQTLLTQHPTVEAAAVLLREDKPGRKQLVAYVVPRSESKEAERVAHWQQAYEHFYASPYSASDPTLNLRVWQSSYTGTTVPEEEIRECVEDTVARILRLQPTRVLEVGCGSGLILSRVAPHCETYVGTDLSQAALDHLGQWLAVRTPPLQGVRLRRASGLDILDSDAGGFDLVVINEVVQHFPSLDYFLDVLRRALAALRPGGRIFLGGLRNLALLRAFHVSVLLRNAPDDLPLPELKGLLAKAVAEENELLIDPRLFDHLPELVPTAGAVTVELKGGRRRNELTSFKYDVVLIKGSADVPTSHGSALRSPGLCRWMDWQATGMTVPVLRRLLALNKESGQIFAVRGVPNARLRDENQALAFLAGNRLNSPSSEGAFAAHSNATLADLRKFVAGVGEVAPSPEEGQEADPYQLWTIAAELGYEALLRWSGFADGAFDALFRSSESEAVWPAGPASELNGHRGDAAFANQPYQAPLPRLSVTLHDYLGSRLPDWMIPAVFVQLPALPLLPSGKVDRRALPPPDDAARENPQAYAPPTNEIEEQLAAIWAEVLGVERVGVHDNFFELGGDSILSIQVVARANRAGLRLNARHLFQQQTVAQLARVAGKAQDTVAEQGLVQGDVPLTPIQHWFFEQAIQEPQHYNQALLLAVEQPLDAERLRRALRHTILHHDALRLRFLPVGQGWRQTHIDSEDHPLLHEVDLSGLSAPDQQVALRHASTQVQGSLDLQRGPLVQGLLFRCRPAQADRLLLVIHHLVIDGVSWRILLETLLASYQQLAQTDTVVLPPKTTSWQDWARRLTAHARSEAVQQELAFWLNEARRQVQPLPHDHDGDYVAGPVLPATVALTEQQTRALLEEAPAVYRIHIQDVLLAALAQTLARWSGQALVLVDVEGHGRADLFEGVDLTGTIGWFTTVHPELFRLPAGNDPGEVLRAVKEQRRETPRAGIGYGLLRYLAGDEAAASLRALPQAQVCFNYLGQVERGLPAEAVGLSLAEEDVGPAHSPLMTPSYPLEINAAVTGGRLQLSWTYNPALYKRSTVDGLARGFVTALTQMIEHCQSLEAGGYTPSDFPLAGLDQAGLDRVVGRSRGVEDVYPLSPLQEGLLFHSLYEPDSGQYIEQLSCTLEGDLDALAFRAAWERVILRHGALRAEFHWEGLNRTLQVLRQRVELPWSEEDWRAVPAAVQETRWLRLLEDDRQQGFVLDRAPLLRWTLVRLTDRGYRFLWSNHHLLMDGWSLGLVVREVLACYEGRRRGVSLKLEEPRLYRDYLGWLAAQDLSAAEAFWRTELAGFRGPTPLGWARRLEGEEGYGEERLRLSVRATTALQAWAREQRVTVHTVLQGAWGLLLSRSSGESDVVFGQTVAGRPGELAGVESMVGLFINTLPVRVRVSWQEEVADWLRGLQQRQAETRPHEHTPLVRVMGWSEVGSGSPLFETLLVFENFPIDRAFMKGSGLQGGDLRVRDVRVGDRTNYALTVVAVPGEELELRVNYQRSRVAGEVVRLLLEQWQTLLETLPEATSRPVQDWQWLAMEDCQILTAWNQTQVVFPEGDRRLHDLVAEQARQTPDAVAVVFGEHSLSYAELNRKSNRLAQHLKSLGVGPDVRVGICVERSLDMVVGLVAILKAGGAYVPLDPDYPSERLAFMAQDARMLVLLTQTHLRQRLPSLPGCLLCLDADSHLWADASAGDPASGVGEENPAYVIYTSGSTGRPKGVAVPHRAVVNLLLDMKRRLHFGCEDGLLAVTTLSFDIAALELFLPLLAGGRVVLASRETTADGEALAELLEQVRPSVMQATPATWRLLLAAGWRGRTDLRVLCGGEALGWDLAERLLGLGMRLWNVYGPTETTIWSTAAELETGQGLAPIGRPVANTQVYVLDREMHLAPVGAPGELYIGGVGVARGYLHRSDLTAARFVPDPFSGEPGSRLYRTGDRVRWRSDGQLEYLGRLDFQVKIRGFRIELGEVEAAMSQHPGVRQAVVVAGSDSSGGQRLLACVLFREDQVVSVEQWRAFLQQRLPAYMIPAAYVMVASMPLTPSGKVDRRTLLALAEKNQVQASDLYVAPRTPLEAELAALCAEVLSVERVGVTDNFFELGGHSLLALQLLTRIRVAYKVELPLRELFVSPTVAALAEHLETLRWLSASSVVETTADSGDEEGTL